ncbi:hypothetical protein X943_002234 [Babesia divergens]|uniref:Uncharacterized protein n=1 Tax=Babesia divergens TaxID=32595 RepID=A0AAD9GDF9_BABDI|nr:hypothetical protein X943_002234 [Babesia divergens]
MTLQFCDGAHILEADCENLLEDSLESCKGAAECTFLCHTAKKRYPPRSSAVSEILESSVAIPNSSASWLCSGSGWLQLYPKNGWVTAIKGSVLRDLCKPFTVWLNQTSVGGITGDFTLRQECTQGDTLDVAREITPAEASQLWVLYLDRKSLLNRCANMAGCSFFTMVRSTFRPLNGVQSLESHESTMEFGTLVHFCKGVPSKVVARDGHFLVTVRAVEQTSQLKPTKRSSSSRIAYYFGGPLTNDAYYDDKTPGSLVPATRL